MPRSRYVQSPINVQYSLLAVVLAQPVGVHVHTLFNSGHCSWSYHLRATDPPPGTTIGRAKITPTRNSITRSRKQQIFPAEFPHRQCCEQCGWARQSVPRPKQLAAAQCSFRAFDEKNPESHRRCKSIHPVRTAVPMLTDRVLSCKKPQNTPSRRPTIVQVT